MRISVVCGLWLSRRARDCRRDAVRFVAAAVFGQVADQAVHRGVVRRVDELASQSPLGDQTGMQHLLKVKGQGRRRHVEPFGDVAGGKAVSAFFDQQPVDGEPVIVGDSAKCGDNLFCVHVATFR